MTQINREKYFKWLCGIINVDRAKGQYGYSKLLTKLFNTEFYFVLENDDNRLCDGLELRDQYVYENIGKFDICDNASDNPPCSILEMMVALACRAEDIMNDPDIGDRTAQWFWRMINSLGLSGMTDGNYDDIFVEQVLNNFLDRKYDSNGAGGLFIVNNCAYDLRDVEIWAQLCYFLDSIS